MSVSLKYNLFSKKQGEKYIFNIQYNFDNKQNCCYIPEYILALTEKNKKMYDEAYKEIVGQEYQLRKYNTVAVFYEAIEKQFDES